MSIIFKTVWHMKKIAWCTKIIYYSPVKVARDSAPCPQPIPEIGIHHAKYTADLKLSRKTRRCELSESAVRQILVFALCLLLAHDQKLITKSFVHFSWPN